MERLDPSLLRFLAANHIRLESKIGRGRSSIAFLAKYKDRDQVAVVIPRRGDDPGKRCTTGFLKHLEAIKSEQDKGRLLAHVVRIIKILLLPEELKEETRIYFPIEVLEYGPVTLAGYIERSLSREDLTTEEKERMGWNMIDAVNRAYDSIENEGYTYTDGNLDNIVVINNTLKFIDLDTLQIIDFDLSSREDTVLDVTTEFGLCADASTVS